MNAHKFAVGGVVAGAVLATVGLLQANSADVEAVEPAANVSVVSLEPVHGMAPIEDVIALWQGRSDEHEFDYLSRTQLGAALSTQARENANLAGYEAAEVPLREALAINPSYSAAKLTLASVAHSQHRFREANQLATEVRLDKPTSLSALALVGDTQLELGDYEAAAASYAQLAAGERSAPVISRLARLASITGNNDEALLLAAEALAASEQLALRPSASAYYWFQLGHFRFLVGDNDGAQEAYETSLRIAPANPAASEALAFQLAAVGQFEAAAEIYERLLISGPAADIHGSYADVLRLMGDDARAQEQDQLGAALAIETIDRFPAERRHLASFFMTRDAGTAVELAELDLAERQDVGGYETLAWALYNDGQFSAAADAAAQVAAVGSSSAEWSYHAGAIAAANGDADSARVQLTAAIDVNPFFHPTEAAAAQTLLESLR